MKNKFSRMLTVLAAALTLSTVPSCIPEEFLEGGELIGLLETLGGTTGTNGETYDESGNPIYGYDGDQPVYGYDALGDPIYLLAALTADSTVPQWEPLPGAAPRPHGMHRGGPPPHARHHHGSHLKRPGEKVRRPRGLFGHRPRGDRHHDRHHGHMDRGDRPDRNRGRMERGERPDRNRGRMERGERPDRNRGSMERGERPDRNRGRMERGARPDRGAMKRGGDRAERKRPDARPGGVGNKSGRGGEGKKERGKH